MELEEIITALRNLLLNKENQIRDLEAERDTLLNQVSEQSDSAAIIAELKNIIQEYGG